MLRMSESLVELADLVMARTLPSPVGPLPCYPSRTRERVRDAASMTATCEAMPEAKLTDQRVVRVPTQVTAALDQLIRELRGRPPLPSAPQRTLPTPIDAACASRRVTLVA